MFCCSLSNNKRLKENCKRCSSYISDQSKKENKQIFHRDKETLYYMTCNKIKISVKKCKMKNNFVLSSICFNFFPEASKVTSRKKNPGCHVTCFTYLKKCEGLQLKKHKKPPLQQQTVFFLLLLLMFRINKRVFKRRNKNPARVQKNFFLHIINT